MIVKAIIRRRAALDESISAINNRFVSAFAALTGFWGDRKDVSDAVFENSAGVGGTLDLRKCLADGIKGQISYVGRLPGYISDEAKADDFISLRLDADKVDRKVFCAETLPELIKTFQAYRAVVQTDEKIQLADWNVTCKQARETGRSIDGRDSVFRIWPVSFFDDLLCQRSFGIGAEEVVRRASPECEHAVILNGGAFLLVSSELVVGDALNDLNARLMSRLNSQ